LKKIQKNGIERVIKLVIQDKPLGVSQEKYIAAIKSTLLSTEELSTLIPQPHSDQKSATIYGNLRGR
jgi:hypothetical protein